MKRKSDKPTTGFDAERHEYRIDGRVVPSVTQIMNDVLPRTGPTDDYYLGFGKARHACYAMLARGEKFVADSRCEPYCAAWRAWAAGVGISVFATECPVFSRRYLFGGTFDLLAHIGGSVRELVLVDYKTSFDARLPIQLGGYAIAVDEGGAALRLRYGFGVQLNPDDTWRMSERFDLRRPRQEFLALLTAYNLRRRMGIEKEEGMKER